MGQSAPTVTDAFETFQSRYAAFRTELEPREQAWFDELVCAARRHSNAINRRPHLDFERPVMLAMLIAAMGLMDDHSREMGLLRKDLHAALAALQDAGFMARRLVQPAAVDLGKIGQTMLVEGS